MRAESLLWIQQCYHMHSRVVASRTRFILPLAVYIVTETYENNSHGPYITPEHEWEKKNSGTFVLYFRHSHDTSCIGYKWISILIAVTNSFNIQDSIDSENQMRCVTTTDVITSRCGENEWFWLIPFMTAQFTSSFTWLFAFPHFDMRHQLKYDVFFLSINFNSKGAMKFFAVYCTNLLENKDEHFYFHEFSKVDF